MPGVIKHHTNSYHILSFNSDEKSTHISYKFCIFPLNIPDLKFIEQTQEFGRLSTYLDEEPAVSVSKSFASFLPSEKKSKHSG